MIYLCPRTHSHLLYAFAVVKRWRWYVAVEVESNYSIFKQKARLQAQDDFAATCSSRAATILRGSEVLHGAKWSITIDKNNVKAAYPSLSEVATILGAKQD